MVSFQTNPPNLGKFWRTLDGKMLIYVYYGHLECFKHIWDSLRPFGTFCVHLVHFIQFWYHVCTKKNPATLPGFESRQGVRFLGKT
jgi:hypothetical protein